MQENQQWVENLVITMYFYSNGREGEEYVCVCVCFWGIPSPPFCSVVSLFLQAVS